MKASGKTSIFTQQQYADAASVLRRLQEAKDLCEKAGRCGLDMSDYAAEIEQMQAMVSAIKANLMDGHTPAKTQA